MFTEAKSPQRWIITSVLIFLALTIPNSWLLELDQSEAIYTLIAKEILEKGDFFITHLQGNPTNVAPLTPWFLCGIFKILPANEFTIRLIGISALGTLAILCGFIAFRSVGPRGAAVTSVATMSSYIALKQGILGDENMLFALLINASWLVWYTLGRGHHQWLYAWFFAHILVFVAILSAGFKAIFFFYFPLLFLRRPLKIWLRLRQADHILSAIFLCLLILVWMVTTPYQMERTIRFFQEFEHHETSTSYIVQLLIFPLASILSYMPWVFLAWPAFCIAFQPLEKDPILGQFLRTIVLSLFYFFWLFPEARPEIITPLVGPLSILIGLNYEILVRRYGKQLLYLPKSISWFTLSAIGICGLILLVWGTGEFTFPKYHLLLCITLLCSSIIMAIIILKARLNVQIWFIIAFSILTFRLAYSSCYYGLCSYDELSTRRKLGKHLSESLPGNITIYEMISDKKSFPTLCHYLQYPVSKISDVGSLPFHEDTVFVLSQDEAPISRNRNWFPVSKVVAYDEYKLRMWKGEKRTIEINPDHLEFQLGPGMTDHEDINQIISISHGFSKAISVRIFASDNGYLNILGPREVTIPPGEVFELTVRVNSEIFIEEEAFDSLQIEFNLYNKTLFRVIRVTIVKGVP